MILSGKDVIKMCNEKFNVENNKEEIIKIVNKNQVVFYIQRNVFPVMVQLGFDDRLVFVFLKKDTVQCWQEWKAYTVQRKLEKWKEALNLYDVPSCDFDLDYDDDYFFNE